MKKSYFKELRLGKQKISRLTNLSNILGGTGTLVDSDTNQQETEITTIEDPISHDPMKASLFFIQFKNQLFLDYEEKQIYGSTDSIYAPTVRFGNEGHGHLS